MPMGRLSRIERTKASLSRSAFSACLRSLMSRTMLWKYFLPSTVDHPGADLDREYGAVLFLMDGFEDQSQAFLGSLVLGGQLVPFFGDAQVAQAHFQQRFPVEAVGDDGALVGFQDVPFFVAEQDDVVGVAGQVIEMLDQRPLLPLGFELAQAEAGDLALP